MSIWRLVIGILWLVLGLIYIVGRNRLRARHVRLRGRFAQPPMLWLVLGWLYALLGVVWVTSAFV